MSELTDALCGAVYDNDLNKVKELVSQGVDITADNNYAVRRASRNGRLDVVKYLVSQGASL